MFRRLLTALSMLTFLPVSSSFSPTEQEIRTSGEWFFAVGLFGGALFYFLAKGVLFLFPVMPSAAILTICMPLFSRCFHLDGLADTADGFLSSRSRNKILEIMHDSRIGTMGVFAMLSDFLLKFAILCDLNSAQLPIACGLAVLGGRTAMTFVLCLSSYARPNGLAKLLYEHKPWTGFFLSLLCMVCTDHFLTGRCFTALPCLIFVPLWSLYTKHKIGGATGDTTGACCELSELIMLLSFAVFEHI